MINAIYHRSYEEREAVEVRIGIDELIILSYPGPDRSVQLDQLRVGRANPRRYRNRRIGEFLEELELTEGRCTERGVCENLSEVSAVRDGWMITIATTTRRWQRIWRSRRRSASLRKPTPLLSSLNQSRAQIQQRCRYHTQPQNSQRIEPECGANASRVLRRRVNSRRSVEVHQLDHAQVVERAYH